MAENQSQQRQAAARAFIQHHPEDGSSGNFRYVHRLGEELIENSDREGEPAEAHEEEERPICLGPPNSPARVIPAGTPSAGAVLSTGPPMGPTAHRAASSSTRS